MHWEARYIAIFDFKKLSFVGYPKSLVARLWTILGGLRLAKPYTKPPTVPVEINQSSRAC